MTNDMLRASRPFLATIFLFSGLCAIADEVPTKSASTGSKSDPASFESTVRPFLKSYCTKCHGADQQKGERRFDQLPPQIHSDNTLVDFQDILDQLNLAEMPPQDARQPPTEESRAAIDWLTQQIAGYHEARQTTDGETILRRLNAREYRNTVRDLLRLNMTMFDPTASFPRDQTTEHLDNVGETLVTSGYLLAKYLSAADHVVSKAMTPATLPEARTWTFRDRFRQQPEIDQVHGRTNGFSHITLYDVVGADKPEGAYGPILAFKEGVPYDGIYELRIKAEAVNRLHPYDPKFLGTDPAEPLRLGIVAGNYLAGPLHKPQPIEPLLAELDLADESKWYTVRVWLDAGYTPRFTFRNGLMDVRSLWSQLLKKYDDQFPPRKDSGIVEARFNAIKYGKLPQIHIHEIEIEGPFYEAWPTDSQRAVLGNDWGDVQKSGVLSEQVMREHLTTFASRAYRRPAASHEVDRIMQVVKSRLDAGRTPLEAYTDGLKTVLCSPNFLFLEGRGSVGEPLSQYALASRLSYFLWSSMPDDELRGLAARDKLQEPEVLRSQVERMLDDPKSAAFVEGFLDSWLTLRDLGSSPPDRSKFEEFYHYDLGQAMREETRLFTRYLLDNNLSIVNFLDSDFTFVNKRLAELYDCELPQGSGFERVSLTDGRRGGLLGQSSVLTVTANGIDTSPVVRGVWLLENILGTPPAPPPPNVEPLDPDIRGAKTIRDQLSKHRDVASCYDC
ncbi:MAG: DUF1592 domain-containing protein, partial [Planctomycetaceae bacterium]|nr:DUF1592 domain-containing protein [Planctomycetaceae bacterium]